MKTYEKLVSWSLQTTRTGDQITNKLLKHILAVYLKFAFEVKKAILRYYRKEVFKLIPIIYELKTNR